MDQTLLYRYFDLFNMLVNCTQQRRIQDLKKEEGGGGPYLGQFRGLFEEFGKKIIKYYTPHPQQIKVKIYICSTSGIYSKNYTKLNHTS